MDLEGGVSDINCCSCDGDLIARMGTCTASRCPGWEMDGRKSISGQESKKSPWDCATRSEDVNPVLRWASWRIWCSQYTMAASDQRSQLIQPKSSRRQRVCEGVVAGWL